MRSVVEAIYTAALSPDVWSKALSLMIEHVGGNGAMFVFNAPFEKRVSIVTGHLREDLGALYIRGPAYAWNPWTMRLTAAPRGFPSLATTMLIQP